MSFSAFHPTARRARRRGDVSALCLSLDSGASKPKAGETDRPDSNPVGPSSPVGIESSYPPPVPAPRMAGTKSHDWLRLGAGDLGSSFHLLLLDCGPTSRIGSTMAALFSRNSRRHPESHAAFGLRALTVFSWPA